MKYNLHKLDNKTEDCFENMKKISTFNFQGW